MKIYLALFLSAFISTLSFGQSNYQDVVYLKNGNIIRGIIIEQVPNKSIKIETTDKDVFVYQFDEIEKLTKEQYQGPIGLPLGYKGIVELGYQIGVAGYIDGLKLNFINGYQINPYFSMGFGTGCRYYYDAQTVFIPFFADIRANFINNRVSPYLSLGVGYSFDALENFEGSGLLLNPTVGVSFKVSDKSAMNVGLGYEHQVYVSHYDDDYYDGYYYHDQEYTSYDSYGAISVNVGISF